jgi:hypothetical protein
MPQSLPAISRARAHSAPVLRAVRTFQTSPHCSPDLVRIQPYWFEDLRTKSTGGGEAIRHSGALTSNLEPSTSNPPHAPLPLSAVLRDNVLGCAWPDRTSFRKKIQDGQQGPKALCRGVSGVWPHRLPFPKQAACQPRWLATIGELTKCAKSSHCSARSVRTVTTPPPRTRRRPLVGLSSPSSATPAASIRPTRKRNRAAPSS